VADLILKSISINKHGALVFVSIVSKIWDEKSMDIKKTDENHVALLAHVILFWAENFGI
jgi:hypothetical protein